MNLVNRIACCHLAVLLISSVPSAAQEDARTEVSTVSGCEGFGIEVRDPGPGAIALAARLAEHGPRPATGGGELNARSIVASELEAAGLEVEIEAFEYQTFVVERTTLELGGVAVEPVVLGLDPFSGDLELAGEAVVVTDPAQGSGALKGRVVVTNHPLMQLLIAEHEPAAVIAVAPEDLERFVSGDNLRFVLRVVGQPGVLRSANVVARCGPRRADGREILVTSHLDAYRDSPGANDNGTGLGVMVELARAFARKADRLPAPITFVAFGAEENGAIGSRAFVRDHEAELASIAAVVNLDTLGGALGPVIASKPAPCPDAAEKPGYRVPEGLRGRAWEGPDGRWRMLHPEIIPAAFASCYPEWLHEIVSQSASDLDLEPVHLDLISDHRSLALAGVPAISIQSKEHHIHSADDTAAHLVPETVGAGGALAFEILCRLQRRFDTTPGAVVQGEPAPTQPPMD